MKLQAEMNHTPYVIDVDDDDDVEDYDYDQ
jgi:hypothetical protein